MAKETMTIGVTGMTCRGCEGRVKAALESVPGVKRVTADKDAATATVVGKDLDPAALRAAVAGAGYTTTD